MRKNIVIGLIVAWAFAFGFQLGRAYEISQEINAIRAALAKQSPMQTTTEAVCPPDETCEVDAQGGVRALPQDYAVCELGADGLPQCPASGNQPYEQRSGRIVLEPYTR